MLDAWAKSNGGGASAERCEKILKWMDELHRAGNTDIQPDTISFNACIDAWYVIVDPPSIVMFSSLTSV